MGRSGRGGTARANLGAGRADSHLVGQGAAHRCKPGHGLQARLGPHAGECVVGGEKISGLAVHIGARISALAPAGRALVSQTVKDLVAGSGLQFDDFGVHTLKGVSDSWRLYAVRDNAFP